MGTKNNPGNYDCHEKAGDDEPIFTLRAKDPLAADLVADWATRSENGGHHEPEKIAEAVACAKSMREWYRRNVGNA